jgi:hypothetical protein
LVYGALVGTVRRTVIDRAVVGNVSISIFIYDGDDLSFLN